MKKTLIVVALVVAVFLGYAVFQKTKNIAQSTEVISDKTEWKTHVHSAGDYSFKYPGNWFVLDDPRSNYVDIANYDVNLYSNNPHAINDKLFRIEIFTATNPKNLNLDDWLREYKEKTEFKPFIKSSEEISVDGFRAIRERFTVNNLPSQEVYIQANGGTYFLGPNPSTEEFQKFFDEFLGRIKFINK